MLSARWYSTSRYDWAMRIPVGELSRILPCSALGKPQSVPRSGGPRSSAARTAVAGESARARRAEWSGGGGGGDCRSQEDSTSITAQTAARRIVVGLGVAARYATRPNALKA